MLIPEIAPIANDATPGESFIRSPINVTTPKPYSILSCSSKPLSFSSFFFRKSASRNRKSRMRSPVSMFLRRGQEVVSAFHIRSESSKLWLFSSFMVSIAQPDFPVRHLTISAPVLFAAITEISVGASIGTMVKG